MNPSDGALALGRALSAPPKASPRPPQGPAAYGSPHSDLPCRPPLLPLAPIGPGRPSRPKQGPRTARGRRGGERGAAPRDIAWGGATPLQPTPNPYHPPLQWWESWGKGGKGVSVEPVGWEGEEAVWPRRPRRRQRFKVEPRAAPAARLFPHHCGPRFSFHTSLLSEFYFHSQSSPPHSADFRDCDEGIEPQPTGPPTWAIWTESDGGSEGGEHPVRKLRPEAGLCGAMRSRPHHHHHPRHRPAPPPDGLCLS